MRKIQRVPVNLFKTLGVYTLLLALLWTAVLGLLQYWNILEHDQTLLETGRVMGRAAFLEDELFQDWAGGLGGVYVAPAAPGLEAEDPSQLPATTTEGKQLSLMGPTTLLRNIFELQKEGHGTLGHITSLDPVRAHNAPDAWETAALQAFARGATEVSSVELVEGVEYLRLMRPLLVEPGCLTCHEEEGRTLGQVRGGISERVPLEPLRSAGLTYAARLSAAHIAIWLLGLAALALGALRLDGSLRRRQQLEQRLLEMSSHDALTGLFNRHYFEEAQAELERQERSPLTALVADVDGLKRVNDELGHAAGDELLRAAAAVLRRSFRNEDIIARTGGDEFVVLLPGSDASQAAEAVQRVRRALVEHNATHPPAALSLSMGAATCGPDMPLAEALRQADQAMYAEKAERKNNCRS